MTGEDTGRTARTLGVGVVAALCVAAAVRLRHAGLGSVPAWVALIALVFGVLELLSVGWNVVRRKPWNERTILDYISDALGWLPWP